VVNPDQEIDLEGGIKAYPFEVDHISGSMGWHLESSGISVVFSGDTRMCDKVAIASRDVDVLIHEALGTEEYKEGVKRRGHSTAGEAGQIADLAGAKRLIMTHIDSRFHSNTKPLVQEAEQYFKGQIDVANDLTQIIVGH
jgi:ribonuclease Z